MRYIPLEPPDADSEYHADYSAFIGKANELLAELKAASDAEARNDIIDKNKALWGKLKGWLLSLSHGNAGFLKLKTAFSTGM